MYVFFAGDLSTVAFFAKLALAVAIICGLWWLLTPRCLFVIRVSGGLAKSTRGNVPPAVLEEIEQACVRGGIENGTVRAVRRRGRVGLAFSPDFPLESQQQLRNWWINTGWKTQFDFRRRHK